MYGIDDALLIGGLAASATGAGMGIAGNEAARNAMNAARSREVQQQKQLQDQANSVFQTNIAKEGADTAKNQAASGTAQRESLFNSLHQLSQPVAGASLPTDDSNTVVNTEGGQSPMEQANALARARGNAFTNVTSGAQAAEGGLRDWQNVQGIQSAEANRRLGVIGNKAQADASLLPVELQVASGAGDELSGWGSLIGALGSTASTAGAVGAFAQPAVAAGGSTSLIGGTPAWAQVPTDAWSALMQAAPQAYRKRYQPIF